MKNYFLLLLLLIAQINSAQSFLKSFPDAYNSHVTQAAALDDEKAVFAVAYQGGETNYSTKNSFKVVDTNGVTLWEGNLSAEGNSVGEFYEITDLKATPDGGWLASGGYFECDYYVFGFAVKYSADFTEEWLKTTDDYFPGESIGHFNGLQISDDKIHLHTYNDIFTIDYDGNLLHRVNVDNYLTFAVANDSLIYAFSNATDWDVLNYPEGTPTDEVLPFPNNFNWINVLDEAEGILVLSNFAGSVKMYQNLTNVWSVQNSPGLNYVDFFKNNNGDICSASLYNDHAILHSYDGLTIDATGEFSFPEDTKIFAATAIGNQFMIAGKERYVPEDYYEKQSVSVVFSQLIGTGETSPQPTLDLAVSAVSFTEPVMTTLFDSYPDDIGHRYKFYDIAVTITNNSSETINSFAVNTRYEAPWQGFCQTDFDFTRRIENAALAPNESQVVFIDSLSTNAVQNPADYQLCFWVTSPNNEPDAVGENDIFCTNFVRDFVASTENNLLQNQIKLFPNPTSDYLYLENAEGFSDYEIFTVTGQKMMAGSLNNGQKIIVKNLEKGVYFLQISEEGKSQNLKFVKE